MNIYFHEKHHSFFHTEKGPIFWGFEDEFIQRGNGDSKYAFTLREKDKKIGPLIGILTGKNKAGLLSGNGPLFKDIQCELQKHGGFSFIFTLDDVKTSILHGYFYHPDTNRWLEADFPFPEVVYNRLPFRKKEEGADYHSFVELLRTYHIPYFNPCFIDKLTMHKVLNRFPSLANHLPETISLADKKSLYEMAAQHGTVYLKPVKQSQGKGIMLLIMDPSGKCRIIREKQTLSYPSFEEMWDVEGYRWTEHPYLIQEKIKTAMLNDRKYDLRGHAHYRKKTGYRLTGIGVRLANDQQLTTHVKRGGALHPYESIQDASLEKKIGDLIKDCGTALSDHYGFFGEFSFDIGIDEKREIWIFEVNAKPMSFDETDIEEKKRAQLVQLFYELSSWQ